MPRPIALRLALALWFLFLAGSKVPLQAQDDAAKAKELATRADHLLEKNQVEEGYAAAKDAVRLDPRCGQAYGARGHALRKMRRNREALTDLDSAIQLDPGDDYYFYLRCLIFLDLDEYRSAYADADRALAHLHGNNYEPNLLMCRGQARIGLGEVDAGLADMTKASGLDPKDPVFHRLSVGFVIKADWEAVLAEVDGNTKLQPTPNPAMTAYQVRALCELGRVDEAVKIAEETKRRYPQSCEASRCRAIAYGTAGPQLDLEKAVQALAGTTPFTSEELNDLCRAYVQAGRFSEAVTELETKGSRENFSTVFLLAAAHHGLGNRVEARRYLTIARRLNPYVGKHAAKVPGLDEILKAVERELAPEKGDALKLVDERAKALMSVAEMETLVRRCLFSRAVSEYGRYREALASDARRQEVDRRLEEVRGMASVLGRFSAQLNAGKLPGVNFKADKVEVTLQSADADGYGFVFKQGSGKASWVGLGVELLIQFLKRANPTPEETLALGILAHDAGLAAPAFELLQKAVKDKAGLKPRLYAFLASQRGIDAPSGGFVAYKGRFVTPEEKTNLDKGLILFQGAWVAAADRENLAKGLVKIDGKWVPGEEAKLLAAGYRKFKDKWYGREEYQALRGEWENACEVSTAHYDIRTNKGDEFAETLGQVAEAAYADLKKFYGDKEPKLPGKERMTLWAFARFEDYRKYCVEHKHEDHLQASGFAVSDTNVVVGWDKTNHTPLFLQTMAHEAAHLYYFRVAGATKLPSWYAEGMATQLEGMQWNGKGWEFDHVSRSRLPFVKQATLAGKQMPLKDLLAGDALQLINSDSEKALLFYAECWALVYYLTQSNDQRAREGFRQYREAIDSGSQVDLEKFLPDLAQIETEFTRFVKGL